MSSFSALQRAEIAEIVGVQPHQREIESFSALQRAEIAEMLLMPPAGEYYFRFSALQRAEIAEIRWRADHIEDAQSVFQCSSTSRNC